MSRSYKVVLYTISSVPVIAILQGCYFLTAYRRQHGNAPFPASPSSGFVVAERKKKERDIQYAIPDNRKSHKMISIRNRWFRQKEIPDIANRRYDATSHPLRLLVVGDSLAAGVGITTSGIPILPQAIAKALSMDLGGRPVQWTCLGTPGASAKRIIHDIESMHALDMTRIHNGSIGASFRQNGSMRSKLNYLIEKHFGPYKRKSLGCADITKPNRHIHTNTRNGTNSLFHVSYNGDEISKNVLADAEELGHYDIAVVLTGMNDIKSMFLPFLTEHGFGNDASFADELKRLYTILKTKMKSHIEKGAAFIHRKGGGESNRCSTVDTSRAEILKDSSSSISHNSLIVLPAIPTQPITFLRYQPLGWLVTRLLEIVETQKKVLARENPGTVLYVEAPSLDLIEELEAGKGLLHEKRKAETVAICYCNVSQKTEVELKKDMARRIESHLIKVDQAFNIENDIDDAFEMASYIASPELSDYIGSTLVSYDKMHPNEEGYDFYGRYIAAAIIQEWKKND